jgi:hypothetical protein
MATADDKTRPDERRTTSRRQPAQGTICELTSDAGEDLALGLVWTVSTGGVSMLLARRLEPGTAVRGSLVAPDGRATPPLELRVAHVARLRTGDYVIGGQFRTPLASDDLQPFLART